MTQPEQSSFYYTDMARLGEFAAHIESLEDREVGDQLFRSVGNLALTNQRPTGFWRWYERYGHRDHDIEVQADLLKAYDEKFAGPIAELHERLQGPNAPKPLAETPTVHVHVIEVDDKRYAVRFADWRLEGTDIEPLSAGYLAHSYMKNLHSARGKSPQLEQLEGFSYKDGTTVAQFIESVPFTNDVIDAVPDRHIDELLRTAEIMRDNRLYPDAEKKSNLPYHPDTGFYIIDFYSYDRDVRLGDIIGDIVPGLVSPLTDTLEHEALAPQDYEARLAFLNRVLQRCRSRYAGTDPETLRLIEHHFTNFRKNGLAPALARWHTQHTTPEQGDTTEERAAPTATVAEVRQALQDATEVISAVQGGLHIQEQQLRVTLATLRSVLQGSNHELADDVMRSVVLAADRLFQVVSHLDESSEAFNIAMQQYGRHPL
jgi:hypothetical protein